MQHTGTSLSKSLQLVHPLSHQKGNLLDLVFTNVVTKSLISKLTQQPVPQCQIITLFPSLLLPIGHPIQVSTPPPHEDLSW